MTPEFALTYSVKPALSLLPATMSSPAAMAMLLSIGLQESGFMHRQQIGGPARGHWQFERGGGVNGVLTHPATKDIAAQVCGRLDFTADAPTVYAALGYNDVLACVFARLLLWSSPMTLPGRSEPDAGWQMYTSCWRPGKPHPASWEAYYRQAWNAVTVVTEGVKI